MSRLADSVKDIIEEIKTREFELSAVSDAGKINQRLYHTRRKLEAAYCDYLKQGDTIPVSSSMQIECPQCQQKMMNADHLYLHLRKNHKVSEEESAVASTAQLEEYDSDIATLRRLLGKHTEVLLEDNEII